IPFPWRRHTTLGHGQRRHQPCLRAAEHRPTFVPRIEALEDRTVLSFLCAQCLGALSLGDFPTWLVDGMRRWAWWNFGTPPLGPVFAHFLQGISAGSRSAALRNLATLT